MKQEQNRQEAVRKHGDRVIISFRYDFPRIAGGRTAVPGGGAALKVITTGVSFDRPPVTSVRSLSVRPMLMARRVMRLSVMVYTKLPTPSEPTAAAGSGMRSRRPGHFHAEPPSRPGL